jgi:hypothetical protein
MCDGCAFVRLTNSSKNERDALQKCPFRQKNYASKPVETV